VRPGFPNWVLATNLQKQSCEKERGGMVMATWLVVTIAVVGIAILVSIPTALWAMVIYGLVQIVRENEQT
jgi:hypothetical protein